MFAWKFHVLQKCFYQIRVKRIFENVELAAGIFFFEFCDGTRKGFFLRTSALDARRSLFRPFENYAQILGIESDDVAPLKLVFRFRAYHIGSTTDFQILRPKFQIPNLVIRFRCMGLFLVRENSSTHPLMFCTGEMNWLCLLRGVELAGTLVKVFAAHASSCLKKKKKKKV